MNILKAIEELETKKKEVEDLSEALVAELAPHIEAWNVFVKEFDQRWREAHPRPSQPYGEPYPWRDVIGQSRAPVIPNYSTTWREVDHGGAGRIFLSGEYYDGDSCSGWLSEDFVTDQEACKRRLTTEWTEKAEKLAQKQQQAQSDKERKEYERLKAKFETRG
jgi:hypothetical protein